jgi:hypothetical protein
MATLVVIDYESEIKAEEALAAVQKGVGPRLSSSAEIGMRG